MSEPSPAPAKRATLASVAASAGVSVATVSKVLNGRSDVAPSTRARVQTLLDEHAYVVPRLRRAPESAREVELVVDHLFSAYTGEVLQGVLDAAVEHDVTLSISSRQSDAARQPETPSAWAQRLAATGRCAVLAITGELTRGQVTALERVRLPVVLVDPLDPQKAGVPSVGATNFTGGLAAGQHLLALGHRRIGYVGGALRAACNAARVGGLRAALEAEGLTLAGDLVTAGRVFDYDTGLEGGLHLLALPERPTAVFAGSDEVALGVVEAARRHGLRVPQDLSVIGFDDTHLATMGSPPLTTIRQPLTEMGALALRTLLRLVDGGAVESPHVALATRLVVRGSTAPLA